MMSFETYRVFIPVGACLPVRDPQGLEFIVRQAINNGVNRLQAGSYRESSAAMFKSQFTL